LSHHLAARADRARKLLLLTATLTVGLPWGAAAEAKGVSHEPQWWHLATATGRVDGPWLYYLEAQPRVGLRDSRAILRSAFGYSPLKNLSLWVGYAWIPVAAYDAEPHLRLNESRLYQQLSYEHGFGPLRLSDRLRLEQRFLAAAPSGVAWRIRNQVRGAWGLGSERRTSLILWDEIFFDLNTVPGGPQTGFDQNRAFAGVGFKLTDHFTLEVGYLNVITRRPAADTHLMLHVLSTSTNFSFL
jgi:hypothetical protein